MRLLARFAPEPDATASRVRLVGLRNALLGAILMVFGAALVFALDRLAKHTLLAPAEGTRASKLRMLAGVPLTLGYVAFVVGLYRAVTGIHPRDDGTSLLASAGRILFGLVAVAAFIALFVVVAMRLYPPE